jgi:hypothetical protein
MRIYVASSWRNRKQITVVRALRDVGHDVYDYRNPAPGNTGFAWSDIDPAWQTWTPDEFRRQLYADDSALEGFWLDYAAMKAASAFVLVLPCGRSAHLELGWAVGAGKFTCILLCEDGGEPELMYRMVNYLAVSIDEVASWIAKL